jgi:hypothetical protein
MIPVTQKLVENIYVMLKTTPPFARWKMPPVAAMKFKIIRSRNSHGTHEFDGRRHVLEISSRTNQTLATLIGTVAHEMTHIREYELHLSTGHGPRFQRLASLVCRHHGFDIGAF